MREIKFRAWLHSQNRIAQVQCMFFNYSYESCVLSIVTYPEFTDPAFPEMQFHDKEFALMQFTGLRDRNGKEIYEGDIVHLESNWFGESSDYTVKYALCGFFPFCNSIENDNYEPCEVIGNIYENPELVKS